MQMPRPKILALVGPTGVGKTELAVALAERFHAEIVNADSRQVYRRLDIGSAKPTAEQRRRAAHHLVDVVEPSEHFDCATFRQLGLTAIDDILGRGRRVIVAGGTGLYVKALLYGVFPAPPPDPRLRRQLEAEDTHHPGSLHRRLRDIDPTAAARIHANDRMRVVRALEVFELTGRPISAWQEEHRFRERPFDTRLVALSLPREHLYRRIEARCDAMLADGLVDEVRNLLGDGLDPLAESMRSPGYREIADHLRGGCDLRTARERMAQATRRLAKRQLTWFRAQDEVLWLPPQLDPLAALLESFLAA